jgi:hypothetical protein
LLRRDQRRQLRQNQFSNGEKIALSLEHSGESR